MVLVLIGSAVGVCALYVVIIAVWELYSRLESHPSISFFTSRPSHTLPSSHLTLHVQTLIWRWCHNRCHLQETARKLLLQECETFVFLASQLLKMDWRCMLKDHCVITNVETKAIAEFTRNAYWHELEVFTNSHWWWAILDWATATFGCGCAKMWLKQWPTQFWALVATILQFFLCFHVRICTMNLILP